MQITSENISFIADNNKRFKSFSVGQLKILDSFQFIASSLAGLVGYLDESAFKLTTRAFGKNTDLLTRKGIFPYKYLDSFERFKETSIELFYLKLNDESVSEKDDEFAKEIWTKIIAKTWEIIMTYILKLM